jgi:hypothetical protein
MRSAGYLSHVFKIRNVLRFSLKLYVEDVAWYFIGQKEQVTLKFI